MFLFDLLRKRQDERRASRSLLPALPPAQAVRERGYHVFQSLIPREELAQWTATLKEDLGVKGRARKTSIDAVNRMPHVKQVLFDARVLSAVRSVAGDDARFLQVSDLQFNHDHNRWHRDSVYRLDGTLGASTPDWDEHEAPYRVVKIILYLESQGAALAMLPGTHLDPQNLDRGAVAQLEAACRYTVLGPQQNPNRLPVDRSPGEPVIWCAQPGDAIVFDERMFHCGRRIRDGRIAKGTGEKFTLSFVFGPDGTHARRIYSYFRYVRKDLTYRDFPSGLRSKLQKAGLTLSTGWSNYFAEAPDELAKVWLKSPYVEPNTRRAGSGKSVRRLSSIAQPTTRRL